MKLFKVNVDPETGNWLGEPEFVGNVDENWWLMMQQNMLEDILHQHRFETIQKDGELCAIDIV